MQRQNTNLSLEDIKDTVPQEKSPPRSIASNTKKTIKVQEEDRSLHIENLQREYTKRLMKPLQINYRLKLRAEVGMGDVGHVKVIKGPAVLSEDVQQILLKEQVKEIDKISAYHDKQAGIVKAKKKKLKQKSVLEENLESNLFKIIQVVKEKTKEKELGTGQKKKAPSVDTKETKNGKGEKQQTIDFHKQLVAMRAEKDKHLPPKQLNSNVYFRYLQRKMLYLRSMEHTEEIIKVDDGGSPVMNEQQQQQQQQNNKQKRKPVSILLKNSFFSSIDGNPGKQSQNSFEQQTRTTNEIFNKTPTTSLAGSVVINIREKPYSKAYDLMGMKRDSKSITPQLDKDVTEVSGSSFTSPTNLHSIADHEMNMQGYRNFSSQGNRTKSDPFILNTRNLQIIEQEGEDQTRMNTEIRNDGFENQSSFPGPAGHRESKFSNSQKMRLYGEISSPSPGLAHYTQNSTYGTQMSGRGDKSSRQSLRMNLLQNLQKAKNRKDSMQNEMEMTETKANKKWSDINLSPLLLMKENEKGKNSFRIVRKTKKSKKKGNKNSKGSKDEKAMTDGGYDMFSRKGSADRISLKQEMQNLLTRYGYKEVMIEPNQYKEGKTKMQNSALLEDAINKGRLKKIESFISQTKNKTTKAVKVD